MLDIWELIITLNHGFRSLIFLRGPVLVLISTFDMKKKSVNPDENKTRLDVMTRSMSQFPLSKPYPTHEYQLAMTLAGTAASGYRSLSVFKLNSRSDCRFVVNPVVRRERQCVL